MRIKPAVSDIAGTTLNDNHDVSKIFSDCAHIADVVTIAIL
jgi:hypothetical protein